MSTELSNGVIIPEEYSDDWYDEMSINLRKLNDVITAASDNATDIQRLDTDKANQSDLTALTSRVSQNETDIIALQTAVSGALKREIVQTLPTEDISTTTIYMIRNSESSGTNIYDEYMYINSQWELIGTSATDFNSYYTKNETDNLLSGKVDNSTLGSYYTKTESDTLLSDKANDSDVVHKSGNETISDNKTFSNGTVFNSWLNFTNTSVTKGTIPQSTLNPYRIYFGSGTKYSNSLFNIDTSVSNTGVQILTLRSAENVVNGDDTRFVIVYDPNLIQPRYIGFKGDCLPSANNTYECGSNSFKWKSFNGLNPGSLSLPDLDNGMDISGYITVNSHNEYTPSVDGWISVTIKKTTTSGALALFIYQSGICNSYFGNTSLPDESEFTGMASIPVKAGIVVNIDTRGANTYVYSAKFYPCQGNV